MLAVMRKVGDFEVKLAGRAGRGFIPEEERTMVNSTHSPFGLGA